MTRYPLIALSLSANKIWLLAPKAIGGFRHNEFGYDA